MPITTLGITSVKQIASLNSISYPARYSPKEHCIVLPNMVRYTVLIALLLTAGCSKFRPKPPTQYVYVASKQSVLRDRVAAVSNRTATVENGQKLEVLEHGRRFYMVRTASGKQGWIDERSVVTQEIFDEFKKLADSHANDPAVASAVVSDEVNLHLTPGREAEHFYQLSEGDKLQLLERATLPKHLAQSPATPSRQITPISNSPDGPSAPQAAPMEDWWLVRDARGRTGWLLSRLIDVNAPDAIARYAEGNRIVGAYVLTTVYDTGATDSNGNIPEYVAALAPRSAGLPYDFDQIRVFTWNVKMHRYETAYRDRNIEGYLPVLIRTEKDPYGKSATAQTLLPSFTYRVLAADAPPVVPDPNTGMIHPGHTITKTYRLEGNLVRRIQPPGSSPDDEAHPQPEEKQEKRGRRK